MNNTQFLQQKINTSIVMKTLVLRVGYKFMLH